MITLLQGWTGHEILTSCSRLQGLGNLEKAIYQNGRRLHIYADSWRSLDELIADEGLSILQEEDDADHPWPQRRNRKVGFQLCTMPE